MSGSITFRHGPFQGWSLQLIATHLDGRLIRALVTIATPHPYRDGQPPSLSGIVSLTPAYEGFEHATAADNGGPAAMAELLNWVVEAHRSVLDRSTTIPDADRRHWQAIVDQADHTRADFFARYPDGRVPAFETIDRLTYDPATDTLAGAR